MTKERIYQVRLTFYDCLNNQSDLIDLIQRKIWNNASLSYDEKKTFPRIVANSILSQGYIKAIHNVADNTVIPLGTVHEFALRMMSLQGKKVTLKYFDKKYTIDISDLWKTLYDYFIRLYPRALEEALHISKEMPKREDISSYVFKADEKIKER